MLQSTVEADVTELAGVRHASASIPMATDVCVWEAEACSCSFGWITKLPGQCLCSNDDVVHEVV